MRDLEIRGAGNLLGDEQSGHVAALGFELYMQMLDEAVEAAGRGRRRHGDEDWEPVRLDVNVDAYVPADYIPYEQAKVDVHRRIAGSREVADLVLLREELEDRFGELPEPLRNLISLQQARIKLGQAGARAVTLPRRPAGGDADRARLACGPSGSGPRSPRRCTSPASRSCRCACPTTRRSGSPRWSGPPTCCWRSRARRPEADRADVGSLRVAPAAIAARDRARIPSRGARWPIGLAASRSAASSHASKRAPVPSASGGR